MQLYIFFLMVWLTMPFSIAQNNLLCNGSFERKDSTCITCTCTGVNMASLTAFSDSGTLQCVFRGNGGTPDPFHPCNGWVPNNFRGSQYPKAGLAYVGIGSWVEFFNTREYVSIQITKTLETSYSYFFTIYFNYANKCKYASKDLAAYFSINKPDTNIGTPLPYSPQLIYNGPFGDTLNWTPFSGIYTASGNEEYVTIGNYKHYQDNPDTMILPFSDNPFQEEAYTFLDDAWLIEIPSLHLPDTLTICSGDTVLLSPMAEALWPGITATWQGENIQSSNVLNTSALPTQSGWYNISLSDTGSYSFLVNGIKDSVFVQLVPRQGIVSINQQTNICPYDTVQLSSVCENCPGDVTYQWQPVGDFFNPTTQNPYFVGGNAAQVILSVYAQSLENCFIKSRDTLAVTYLPNELCFIADSIPPVAGSLYIPGVLGRNSLWEWTNNPGDLAAEVYDASGRLVYSSSAYSNSLSSSEMAPGIYLYKVYKKGKIMTGGKLFVE